MTQYTLHAPAQLDARITLPSSKSISNRALLIHALSGGPHRPTNLSDCDDTRVVVRALEEGGDTIDILAAGTAMRFMTAYLSVTPGTRIITGTARMQQRPIRVLVDALRSLGADIEYAGQEGFPPLRITGRTLTCDHISLPGNVSSQYISALLMIAPTLPLGLTLHLTGEIVSRPYIEMTLSLMRYFGADCRWVGETDLRVEPRTYISRPFQVESDWSAASYWYEMVALSGSATVSLPLLYADSLQGDSHVAEMFRPLGVTTTFGEDGNTAKADADAAQKEADACPLVTLAKTGKPVEHLDWDFTSQPDLAQTLVVTCCLLGVTFRFTGLQSLKIKETDRIVALITELRKLGYVVKDEADSILYWTGERCEPQPQPAIDTYEDHRMAMAFAPACQALGTIRINHPEVVTKSYPGYWDDLTRAGFQIEGR
jgi:3-phosphoshikimate 1-carboxyvinyltransferase